MFQQKFNSLLDVTKKPYTFIYRYNSTKLDTIKTDFISLLLLLPARFSDDLSCECIEH